MSRELIITSATATPSTSSQMLARPIRFELPRARNFIEKSLSEDTRRAYTRALLDFFSFVMKLPAQVEVEDVIAYRDDLVKKQHRKARTVNMKLSVVRAYFGYLKAAGDIEINPADTKLVSVPAPPLRWQERGIMKQRDIQRNILNSKSLDELVAESNITPWTDADFERAAEIGRGLFDGLAEQVRRWRDQNEMQEAERWARMSVWLG
jgi:hypothetical protein